MKENVYSSMIDLMYPSEEFRSAFMEAHSRLESSEQLSLMYIGDTADPTWPARDFDGFLSYLTNSFVNPKPGWVKGICYWAIENAAVVGRIGIRLETNEYLRKFNGHIGYMTVPWARNRGVAKDMLRLALQLPAVQAIKPVLLTCDHDNVASERVILANNGVHENTLEDSNGIMKKRFWIA